MAAAPSNGNSPSFWPLHTLLIVAVQCLLFYGSLDPLAYAMPLPISFDYLWAVITCIVGHANEAHLWGNLTTQLTLVAAFELSYGTSQTAAVFWSGGIFAASVEAVTYYVRGYETPGGLIGSSAAVYAILGAYLADLYYNFHERPPYARLALCTAWAFVPLEAFVSVVAPSSYVAHRAHLVGALYGILVGISAARNERLEYGERCARASAVSVATVLGLSVGALLLVSSIAR